MVIITIIYIQFLSHKIVIVLGGRRLLLLFLLLLHRLLPLFLFLLWINQCGATKKVILWLFGNYIRLLEYLQGSSLFLLLLIPLLLLLFLHLFLVVLTLFFNYFDFLYQFKIVFPAQTAIQVQRQLFKKSRNIVIINSLFWVDTFTELFCNKLSDLRKVFIVFKHFARADAHGP